MIAEIAGLSTCRTLKLVDMHKNSRVSNFTWSKLK